MYLQTGAVELPLDRSRTKSLESALEVVGRLREHRLHRPQDLERERRQLELATAECGFRNVLKAPGEHRRATHCSRCHAGRTRHRVEHHALERPLT